MAQVIEMPKLSDTMTEGVLRKWNRKEGDKISPGEVVAEVETDKATMDFEIFDQGVLLKLLVKDGETVPVGAPIAVLGQPGEDISAAIAQAQQKKPAAAPKAEAPKPAAKAEPPKPAAKAEAPQPEAAKPAPRRARRRWPPRRPPRARSWPRRSPASSPPSSASTCGAWRAAAPAAASSSAT
jgi:pyruvate dehydrogenase E2 component (dihydrolipoyllysine-residue acetyltransferase)